MRTWRNEEQIVEKWKKQLHTRLGVLQSSILLSKGKGKKEELTYYNTGYSYLVTHPSTNADEQGSTLLRRRDVVLSLWYSVSECILFNFKDEKR